MSEITLQVTELKAGASASRASLRSSFRWAFAGNVVYAACHWGNLVVLSKLTSPERVGQYALGLAIALPVLMFTHLQLRSLLAGDVRRQTPFAHYLTFRLLSTLAGLAVIVAIPLWLNLRPQAAQVVWMVGVAQSIESISEIFHARLQLHERMDRIAASLLLRGLLGLAAMAAGVMATGSVVWGLAGLAAVRLLMLIGFDVHPATQGSKAAAGARETVRLQAVWDAKALRDLCAAALPLGLIGLLVSLQSNIPRYFIQAGLGERELGIFSAIGFLLSSGSLVIGSLGQSAFTRFALYYAEQRRREFGALVKKLLGFAVLLGLGGVAVAWVAGRPILTSLFRPEYAERAPLLVWLMIAAAVGYLGQILGYAMTAARLVTPQVPLFALTAAVVTVASYLLVPAWGLAGGVAALLVAAVVQLAGSAAILFRAIRRMPSLNHEAVSYV